MASKSSNLVNDEILNMAISESSEDKIKKPRKINIIGEDKNLESLIEEFAGIWEVSDDNLVNYRKIWKQYLPKRDKYDPEVIVNEDWAIAYNPIVAVRKCYKPNLEASSLNDLPYFIVILNSARDHRPQKKNVSKNNGRKNNKSPDKDPLQINLIDKEMIIAEFGNFYLCPNGFPYHRYASLLIAKDQNRRQEYPSPEEIATWMRFSILTKQYVFFNSPYAGASVKERMHAQVVDPSGIRLEGQEVIYPILNNNIVERTEVKNEIDLVRGYGIEALVLRGVDAPHRASLAIKKLRDEQGHWYNLMIKEKEVFIVARNQDKETSHCIGKKVGAYEMSGVILVGNIEEPLLEKIDLDRIVHGAEIFSILYYEQIASNINNATTSLGGIENVL